MGSDDAFGKVTTSVHAEAATITRVLGQPKARSQWFGERRGGRLQVGRHGGMNFRHKAGKQPIVSLACIQHACIAARIQSRLVHNLQPKWQASPVEPCCNSSDQSGGSFASKVPVKAHHSQPIADVKLSVAKGNKKARRELKKLREERDANRRASNKPAPPARPCILRRHP